MALGKLSLLVTCLTLVLCQDLDNEVGTERRREELRWFPADSERECEVQPGGEQVREGRPSKVCRQDEERFCLCGRLGDPTEQSNQWRFLCGTCKISFKLDRMKVDPSRDNRLKANKVKTKKRRLL